MSGLSDFAAYQEAEAALCNALNRLLRVYGLMEATKSAELTDRHAGVVRKLVEGAQEAMDEMSAALGQQTSVDFGSSAEFMRVNSSTLRDMVSRCIVALRGVVGQPARLAWAKAGADVLELLNCYRDADPDFARTSLWPKWLATTFVNAGLKRYLGGDGLAVYYKIIECMINAFDSDPDTLASVDDANKHIVVALLPQDGAGATRDQASDIVTLRGLLS